MRDSTFISRAQTAIQRNIGEIKNNDILLDTYKNWLKRSKTHLLVMCSVDNVLKPAPAAAYLISTEYGGDFVPVVDPYTLLDRYSAYNTDSTPLVYLYGMHMMQYMTISEAMRFISVLRFLLVNGVRCVIPIDSSTDSGDLKKYFSDSDTAMLFHKHILAATSTTGIAV